MSELLAGAVSAGVVEVYKDIRNYSVDVVEELRDYEKSLDKNYEKLKSEVKKLCARQSDLLAKISKDRRKQASEECNLWIHGVKKLVKDVQALKVEYEEELRQQKGVVQWLSRSSLSKRMLEKLYEVRSCLEDGSKFAVDVIVERFPKLFTKAKVPSIEDIPSLYVIFEEIMECLSDRELMRIGLWGKVGVGKTTIMKNLKENEQINSLFDIVFFVSLAEEGNEEKLQENVQLQIAQELNVEGITDTTDIASRISEKLMGMRYLLLLDDVWGIFDLEDVGIFDNGEDSKVVISSRNQGNCREMFVDHIIKVPQLSDEDAWNLFHEILGRNLDHDFEALAFLVIKECDNLPLLLDKVARAFRRKDNILLWEAGLNKLRVWPDVKCDGMDDVYNLLRFCFEELEDDEKICFLYCALFTEGCEIFVNYLLECWRAEGFTQDVKEFTALQKGQEILHDLRDASLIEMGAKIRHVKISRVMRKMALKISSESEDLKHLVSAGKELQEPPRSEDWHQKIRISLMDNKLSTLPEKPYSSNLSTLFLQRNVDLIVIPRLFFENMQSLRVLDLHGTNVSDLPSSLFHLICLRALYLNSCRKLMRLSAKVKKLKHLEVLDIRGTGIDHLPDDLAHLSQLRCFRLSLSKVDGQPSKVKTNVHDIVVTLSSLEELVIDVHPENQWWPQVVKYIVGNLTALTNLNYLSFSIGKCHSSRYKVLDYFGRKIFLFLKYANGEGSSLPTPQLLAETDAFELIGHKGVVKLSDFGIENLSRMKSCLIESCNDMETIIDCEWTIFQSNGIIARAVLESLEKMYLSNIPKLESIWHGPIPPGSLARLNTLVIFKCSKLKKIFPGNLIQQFCELRHLEIEACHELEELTMEGDHSNGMNDYALPLLKTITLVGLPSLRSIWIDNSLDWISLGKKITMCPLLENPPSWRTMY